MIGSLIGAGLSAVGSIFGGIKASQAAQKAKRSTARRLADNDAWFNRRWNEDATQRADAQRILTRTEDMMRNRNREAAGVQAVTGGSEAAAAATKAANAQAAAEAASEIAVAGERRKDALEEQYLARRDALQDRLEGIENQRAQNVTQAASGVAQAAGGIAGAFDGSEEAAAPKEKKDAATPTATVVPGNSTRSYEDPVYV